MLSNLKARDTVQTVHFTSCRVDQKPDRWVWLPTSLKFLFSRYILRFLSEFTAVCTENISVNETLEMQDRRMRDKNAGPEMRTCLMCLLCCCAAHSRWHRILLWVNAYESFRQVSVLKLGSQPQNGTELNYTEQTLILSIILLTTNKICVGANGNTNNSIYSSFIINSYNQSPTGAPLLLLPQSVQSLSLFCLKLQKATLVCFVDFYCRHRAIVEIVSGVPKTRRGQSNAVAFFWPTNHHTVKLIVCARSACTNARMIAADQTSPLYVRRRVGTDTGQLENLETLCRKLEHCCQDGQNLCWLTDFDWQLTVFVCFLLS